VVNPSFGQVFPRDELYDVYSTSNQPDRLDLAIPKNLKEDSNGNETGIVSTLTRFPA